MTDVVGFTIISKDLSTKRILVDKSETNQPHAWIKCNACGKKILKRKVCKRCNIATYCSKECQVKDWPEHKKECKSFQISSQFREKIREEVKVGISKEVCQLVCEFYKQTSDADKIRFLRLCGEKKENVVLFHSDLNNRIFINPVYTLPDSEDYGRLCKSINLNLLIDAVGKRFPDQKIGVIITIFKEDIYYITLVRNGEDLDMYLSKYLLVPD